MTEYYQREGMLYAGHGCFRCILNRDLVDKITVRSSIHFVEDHCIKPDLWRAISSLRRKTSSKQLKINLLLECDKKGIHSRLSSFPSIEEFRVRILCLQKYASAMGYGHGFYAQRGYIDREVRYGYLSMQLCTGWYEGRPAFGVLLANTCFAPIRML